jgi:iron complex transport system permease protein
VLATVAIVSLLVGAGSVGPGRALAVLFGGGDAEARFTVTELRLPRLYVGVAVGLALGLAGCLLQTSTRNVLADPELLGISGSASVVIVLLIALGGATASAVPAAWGIGGALVGSLVVVFGSRIRGVADDPIRLVLAGAMLAGLLRAVTSVIMLVDQRAADEVRTWVVGSIAGRGTDALAETAPYLIAGLVLAALLARPLASLALGDQTARALGHRPGLTRGLAIVATALLVGPATAIAGPLAFVGLVVPVVARSLTGPDIRRAAPVACILGPVLILSADVVARLVVRPSEMPLGVMTAVIGAPMLVGVVRARRMPTL